MEQLAPWADTYALLEGPVQTFLYWPELRQCQTGLFNSGPAIARPRRRCCEEDLCQGFAKASAPAWPELRSKRSGRAAPLDDSAARTLAAKLLKAFNEHWRGEPLTRSG